MSDTEENGANEGAKKLQALKDLNWPTVILILFSGGANLLTTEKNSADREYQVNQAVRQIQDLHNALDDFEKGQKKGLANQTELLEHDTELLKEVHEIATRLDRLKTLDQMRGAPP